MWRRLPHRGLMGLLVAGTLALGMTAAPGDAWGARKAAAKKEKDKEEDAKCRGPYPFKRKFPALQRELDKQIRAAGYGKLLDRKQLAVALVDLSRPGRVFYSGINDDVMLYAASLPKIAILLSVIEAVNAGKLQWNHEFDRRLQQMIVASNNRDASWGVDLVGLLDIEATMRDPRYCLYDDTHGGLWVGRAYRSGGATNRDPLFNISHGSTARQAARYYMMLDAGKLVSPHWSFRMLGLMSPPKHHHKFVGGLAKESNVVFRARKSGSWRYFHSDSALIQQGDRRYIAVGLSEAKNGEQMMRHLARIFHGIITDGKHRKNRKSRQAKK